LREWVEAKYTDGPTVCPSLLVNELSEVFRAYSWHKSGHLPHSGGYAEQPHKLMEMLYIIDDVIEQRRPKR